MFKGFEYKFISSEFKFKAYEHNFQQGKDGYFTIISSTNSQPPKLLGFA